MEIRVLRYFLGVAKTGSMTKAARLLHVTQPTLSRQLQDLEEELDQKLFIRGSHAVSLTPEGMLLRKRAEEILDIVHKTESEFSSMGRTVGGDIYIGGGETEAMRQIAQLIQEVRQDYPEIRFHLYSGNAEDVMERLDRGLLDFGILIQPVSLAKYHFISLPAKDVWGLIMRRDCPLVRKKSITRQDLQSVPLICSQQAVQHLSEKNPYSDWFGKDTADLNIAATYNLIYNAALMVEEGVGCAVALDKLIHTKGPGDLCFRPLNPRLESGLNFVWKKDQLFSRAAELFLKRIYKKFSHEDQTDSTKESYHF